MLVVTERNCVRRMEAQPQALGDMRRKQSRPVAHGNNAIEAPADLGFFGSLKLHSNGAVCPRVFKHVTAVRCQDALHTQLAGRRGKRAHLIASGGGYQ